MPEPANAVDPLRASVIDLADRLAKQSRATAATTKSAASLLKRFHEAPALSDLASRQKIIETVQNLLGQEELLGSVLVEFEAQIRDLIDAVEAEAALAEPGESIPWEQVKAELGLA